MTRIDTVSIALDADTQGFMNGMREAGNLVQKQSGSMVGSIGQVTQSFFYATQAVQTIVATASQVYGFGKAVFDLGANAEETASKFSATLGPATESAQKFLDEFANTAGLTVTEGRELIATTSGIAMGFGFGQTEAAAFAEDVLRLAGDMTSYSNIPIAETSLAIQSALAGERESLKRLGVVINEADVQKRALEMTGRENAKTLTAEEKATASLALIQERAAYMVGNLEMTQDSAANTARRLGAELRQAQEIIARALVPALSEIMKAIGELTGGEGFDNLIERIVASRDQIAAWAVVTVNAFAAATTTVVESIKIMGDSFQFFSNLLEALLQPLAGNFAEAGEALREMRSALSDTGNSLRTIGGSFTNVGSKITDAMNTGLAEVEEFMKGINEADKQVIDMTGSVETAGEEIEELKDRLKDLGDVTDVTNEMIGGLPYHAEQASRGLQRMIDKAGPLGKNFRKLGEEWVNASGQLVRDGRIVGEIEQAKQRSKQLGKVLRSLALEAEPSFEVIKSYIGDLGSGFDLLRDFASGFVAELEMGLSKTDAFQAALEGISSAGFAFILDKTLGVLTSMFASGGAARAETIRLQKAIYDNRRALEQNTDVILRQLTGGMGGQQLVGIGNLLAEFSRRVEESPGAFPEGLWDFLYDRLREMGLSIEDFYELARSFGVEPQAGNVTFIMELGKKINELIGNQLSGFGAALENLRDMLRLRGVSAEDQIVDMIAFLMDAVGPEIDQILEELLTADPTQVGNLIADLVSGLRGGNTDLINALGDIPINDFIAVLMDLFAMFGEVGGALPPETQRTDPNAPPSDGTGTTTGQGTATPADFAARINEMLASIGLTVGPAIDAILASLTPDNAEQMLSDLLAQIMAGEEIAQDLFGLSVEEFSSMIATILELMEGAGAAFVNAFDPSKQIDEAGEAANVAANDIIAALVGSVGDPIDEILQGLTGYNAEEALAALREQILAGGDLAAELGDLEPDAFIGMIDELLGLILQAGDDFSLLALPDLPEDGTGSRRSKADEQFEQMFELHRIGYDGLTQRMTVLEQNVELLIATNRNGFEDVAVAVRSA